MMPPAIRATPLARRGATVLALVCSVWSLLATPVQAGAPADVRISNVADQRFSLSWVTSAAETGYLRWGVDPANMSAQTEDDRGAGVASTTHHVTIGNLAPKTAYYVDVVSGATVDNNGGAHYRVTTGTALDPGSPAPPVYGQLSRSDGLSPAGILVYGTVRDGDSRGTPGASGLLSGVVQEKDQGYWYLNLGLARLADLSGLFSYSPSGDKLALRFVGGPGQALELTLDTGAAAPAAPIVLPAAPPPATATPPATTTPVATATQARATPSPSPAAATPSTTPAPPTLPTATPTPPAPSPSAPPPVPVASPAASPVVSPVATIGGAATPTGVPATPQSLATSGPGEPSATPDLPATPAPAVATPAAPASSTPGLPPTPVPPDAAATPMPAATPAAPPTQSLPGWLPFLLGAVPVAAALLYVAARRIRGS
jgi:hypothetical protein